MSDAMDGSYYAKDGMVWKRPTETRKADGFRSFTIGFPVCTMHEAVGAEQAQAVADLMNAGHTSDPDELNRLRTENAKLREALRKAEDGDALQVLANYRAIRRAVLEKEPQS